jgi:hypothetical protein
MNALDDQDEPAPMHLLYSYVALCLIFIAWIYTFDSINKPCIAQVILSCDIVVSQIMLTQEVWTDMPSQNLIALQLKAYLLFSCTPFFQMKRVFRVILTIVLILNWFILEQKMFS